MLSQETLQGHWTDLKEPLQSEWGQLTDHDLLSFSGGVHELVDLIHMRTGDEREAIEGRMEEIVAENCSLMEKASQSVRDAAAHTAGQLRQEYKQASQAVTESYRQVESRVRQHPAESAIVAFGSGLIAGLVVTLIARR